MLAGFPPSNPFKSEKIVNESAHMNSHGGNVTGEEKSDSRKNQSGSQASECVLADRRQESLVRWSSSCATTLGRRVNLHGRDWVAIDECISSASKKLDRAEVESVPRYRTLDGPGSFRAGGWCDMFMVRGAYHCWPKRVAFRDDYSLRAGLRARGGDADIRT